MLGHDVTFGLPEVQTIWSPPDHYLLLPRGLRLSEGGARSQRGLSV